MSTLLAQRCMVHFWDMKNPWILIGVIAIVLFGGAFWYSSTINERNNEGVEIVDHIKGNPEAQVVLVEYSDLQCPACAAFAPVVEQVVESYGDQVRFEYKHYPLPIHSYAVQAAVAAEAAGQQGKFFPYHDLLFENQTEWSNSPTPVANFRMYAEELGLDMDQFGKHLNSTILRDGVQAQVSEGRSLGVTGTPTFYLNGEQMVIQTYEDFINQVAAAVNPDQADTPAGGETVEFGI